MDRVGQDEQKDQTYSTIYSQFLFYTKTTENFRQIVIFLSFITSYNSSSD